MYGKLLEQEQDERIEGPLSSYLVAAEINKYFKFFCEKYEVKYTDIKSSDKCQVVYDSEPATKLIYHVSVYPYEKYCIYY